MTVLPIKSVVFVVLFGVLALIGYRVYLAYDQSNATENQHRKPILIPGIQEPDELRVEPLAASPKLTAPAQMLADAMKGSGDKDDPNTFLHALNRVIAKYPDYPDTYLIRLGELCKGNDRAAAMSDINSALRFRSTSLVGNDSELLLSLLSMRAKVEHESGDDSAAMDDLEKAIHADLAHATKITNSGGIAPEQTASICTWTQPDMDSLVQHFPIDYRSYLFRGLYFDFFTTFNDNEALRKAALDEFHKATEANGGSALPHYFAARALSNWAFIKQIGTSDEQRKALYRAPLDELNKALALDPDLMPALKERAGIYSDIKEFKKAVSDYDKIIASDPNDDGAYNDRGLAKMELGETYGAINDLTKVIGKHPFGADGYENRAAAYMETRQWDLAIRDLTAAISLRIGQQVLLMNVNRFREVYPEYRTASDELIARKLQQTFYPNFKYEDFSEAFLQKNGASIVPDFVVAETYLKRSDANLKAGSWRAAKIDFRRAERITPNYADRWREISPLVNQRVYLDMKTFNDEHSDAINIWIRLGSDDGPYSLQQFELNCRAHQMRTISLANYDAAGNLTGSRQGSSWGSIVPESLGENLYNGACVGQ